MFLRRGKSGALCWNCCPRDLTPDKRLKMDGGETGDSRNGIRHTEMASGLLPPASREQYGLPPQPVSSVRKKPKLTVRPFKQAANGACSTMTQETITPE